MKPAAYTEPTTVESAKGMESLPEALFGGSETLETTGETDSLWSRFRPRNVPFFKVALLDQLMRRPYHAVLLEGPFNARQMAQDYRDKLFRSETSIRRDGTPYINRLLLCLGGGVFGYLDEEGFKLYAPTPQAAEAAAQQFRRYTKTDGDGKPSFHIISVEHGNPVTVKVAIERTAPVTTDELALNYGTDFPAWEQQWTGRMRQTSSGLSILFGPPGCGKTSYLRALAGRLLDEAVFYYIPVSDAEILSNSHFVSFWAEQARCHKSKQKIAILEDAENLLLARDECNRDKVSNLLNIADGFLGEHLKLHVIATTNIPFGKLDPAIMRPGRLIGSREFRRLNRAEAVRLAKVKGLELPDQSDYSLAEIYCARPGTASLGQQQRIGFA